MTFAVRNTASAGWTGIGFNSNPGMYGADFVVFEPGATTGAFRDMFNHKKPYEGPLDDDHYTITPLRAFKSSSSVELVSRRSWAQGSHLDNRRLCDEEREICSRRFSGRNGDHGRCELHERRARLQYQRERGFYLLYAWGRLNARAARAERSRRRLRPPVGRADGEHFSETSYIDIKPKVATTMPVGDTYACTKHDLGRPEIRDGVGSHQRQSHAFASRAVLRLHGWNERPDRRLLDW